MKKSLKVVVVVVIFLIVTIGTVLAYHGFFSTYEIAEKEVGPYTLATKRFVGGYYKVGPTMTEVDSWLRENAVTSSKGVGLFYDDPAKVPENELRSDVGNVLENVDEQKLAKIKEKFDVKEIVRQKAVVVEFPIKSSLSYMLAPIKVYPMISKYWKEKGYPDSVSDGFSIEIYDMDGKITTYIMPIPEK